MVGLERDAITLEICTGSMASTSRRRRWTRPPRKPSGSASETGIDYRQADMNDLKLEADAYDVAFAVQALHHVDALEHLLDQVEASLRPGGLFVVNEYIGPARFQWLDKTEALMNRLLELLPHEYKVNPKNGFVKERIDRASAEEIARVDPSESIRSDEIVGDCWSRGSRCSTAPTSAARSSSSSLRTSRRTSSEDDPKDVALVDLMSLLEEVLIAERVLPSDFAFFVLSPRE